MKLQKTYRNSSFSIIIAFVCLAIVGASVIPLLNVQLNPGRALPNITVTYLWPNASARIVEQEVTSRLEGLFSSVREIQNIESVSSQGQGRIRLSFKKRTDLQAARFEIANLIRQAYSELPERVSYPEISISSTGDLTSPVLTYRLAASSNPYYIQKYAENNIVPELSKAAGISEIRVYGATPFEWTIEYDPQKIQTLGLTSNDIMVSVNQYFGKNHIGQGLFNDNRLNTQKELAISLQSEKSDTLNWDMIPIKATGGRVMRYLFSKRQSTATGIPASGFNLRMNTNGAASLSFSKASWNRRPSVLADWTGLFME